MNKDFEIEIDKNNDGGDIIEELLETEDKKEKSNLDILGELFNPKNIETKTELTQKQIVLINQKRVLAKLINWKQLDDALDDFMTLQISKDRKGRKEFVEGFVAEREQEVKKNNSLLGMGNMFNKQ